MTNSVPLSTLRPGEDGSVVQLSGGQGFVSRLATLGFTLGVPLTMIRNAGRGPVIVRIRDSRIALGRGEAAKIVVHRGASRD